MPLPDPKDFDDEREYISACMQAQKDENKPQKQKLAICFSKWRSKTEKDKLVEILDLLNKDIEK